MKGSYCSDSNVNWLKSDKGGENLVASFFRRTQTNGYWLLNSKNFFVKNHELPKRSYRIMLYAADDGRIRKTTAILTGISFINRRFLLNIKKTAYQGSQPRLRGTFQFAKYERNCGIPIVRRLKKIYNGDSIPLYSREKMEDGSWRRQELESASITKGDLRRFRSCEAVPYTLSMKLLSRDEPSKIKEEISMTVLGEMLIQDGIEMGIREMMLDDLDFNRFSRKK